MKNRQIQSKSRYFYAIAIGTAIFILGFLLTYAISYLELLRITGLQQDASYDIFSDTLAYSLFEKDLCSVETFSELSKDLGYHGRIIDDLEDKFGKDDERVLLRKKFYTLVELEHFNFINMRNTNCPEYINTILFFYSNKPRIIEDSEEIGRILGVIHSRNDNLVIYSFDMDLDSELIESLKEKYDVTEPNTIILNGKVKVIDFNKAEDIESKFISY